MMFVGSLFTAATLFSFLVLIMRNVNWQHLLQEDPASGIFLFALLLRGFQLAELLDDYAARLILPPFIIDGHLARDVRLRFCALLALGESQQLHAALLVGGAIAWSRGHAGNRARFGVLCGRR